MSYWTDVRYALRLLRKTPMFTLTTILVLAGGLAVSLYTFGLLNTALYKRLPIADGERVMRLEGRSRGLPTQTLDAYELAQIAPQVKALEAIGIYNDTDVEVSDRELSQMVPATYGPWDMFSFVGVQPQLGRSFVPADTIGGAEPVAILSHALWQSAFAGSPDILGRVIHVNRKPVRVIGVMPAGVTFPVWSRLWLPMPQHEAQPVNEATSIAVGVYARLRPGATRASASEELTGLLSGVRQGHPRVDGKPYDYDAISLETFQMSLAGGGAGNVMFAVLNLMAGFIMLLSCVNVGNMLLARTQERLKEIAVRMAIGAPRGRLLWQMMLESLLICVVGGGLALLLIAYWLKATDQFLHAWSDRLPFWARWGVDTQSVLMTFGFVLFAVCVVSILPTWRVLRMPCTTLLRDGTRGARGRLSGRLSRLLVTVQIVLISVVMAISSALTFVAWRTSNLDTGINGERLLALDVAAPNSSDGTPASRAQYHDRLLASIRAQPDVEGAMLWSGAGSRRFGADGMSYPLAEDYPEATVRLSSDAPVSLGARLLDGRYFDSRDGSDGSRSVLVSRTLAERYWPGGSPIGRPIQLFDAEGKVREQRVVVGVVSDVLDDSQMMQADARAVTAIYLPFAQAAQGSARYLVRYRGDESAARATLLNLAWQANAAPGVAVDRYTALRDRTVALSRSLAKLFVYSGLFALLLALTGIYGLCSNEVILRRQEVGLRRAIGATDGSILRLFLRQGARRLAVGLVFALLIGGAGLFLLSRLAGLGTVVPVAIGLGVATTITLLVGMATYLSTRRILRGEPAEGMRYE